MRLRVAFKLHNEDADLARQISDAAGIEPDKLAKVALQVYMRNVLQQAEEMMAKRAATQEGETDGQPSNTDAVLSTGTLSPTPDAVSGETP